MQKKFLSLCAALGFTPTFVNADSPTEAEMISAFDMAAAAAADLKQKAEAQSKASLAEKEIRALIAESGNALSRDSAVQVLADRKAQAAKAKK